MQAPAPSTSFAGWSATFFTRLHRYKMLLKRRWYVLALCGSLGLAYQAYNVSQKTTTYTSTGKLIISGVLNLQDSNLHKEQGINFFGTQLELMRSADVRARASARVKALHPDLTPSYVDLQAVQSPRTNIFILQATGADPAYVQAYLDACLDEYIRMRGGMRDDLSQNTLASLNTQRVRFTSRINDIEDKLEEFHKTHNIVFLEQQSEAMVKRLSDEKNKLADFKKEERLLTLMSSDQHLDKQVQEASLATSEADPNDVPLLTPAMDFLREKKKLDRLVAEKQRLSKVLKPAHPKMQNFDQLIQLQQEELDLIRRNSKESMKNRRETITLEIRNLETQITELEKEAREIHAKKNEYERIKRELERAQAEQDRIIGQMQRVDVGQKLDQEIISVLNRATPARPNTFSATTSLVQGLLVGLALGVGILFLLDRIDDRVNSLTELRDHLQEEVLGQIPLDANVAQSPESGLIVPEDPRHIYVESFRNVRSSLLYMELDTNERPKSLLVTSAIPNEGKSTFSTNLAITMAFSGSRVLLIDADLRRGSLDRSFKLNADQGLADCLGGKAKWQDLILKTGYDNLELLPRGNTPGNPGELFLQSNTSEIFREIRDAYDYVVVDSAPVLATDDTPTLAPSIDGTIFLLRMSHTSMRLVTNALQNLYQRQVNVLGLAMNCVNTQLPEYYYYQYQEYYSSRPQQPQDLSKKS